MLGVDRKLRLSHLIKLLVDVKAKDKGKIIVR